VERPRLVPYEAPGWGVGEVWLEGERVVWAELPRATADVSSGRVLGTVPGTRPCQASSVVADSSLAEMWVEEGHSAVVELPRQSGHAALGHVLGTVPGTRPLRTPAAFRLAERLAAFFAGAPDDFADVELDLEDGFYGDCARALRTVPRGEVVTCGELAALAGRPGAARAAGTFCARNRFAPLVPCHRVVAAGGIGSFGSLGVEYKRRMLALEDVAL
jgi:methylated-DNA-[protein]-cysteine S-methyltransferase